MKWTKPLLGAVALAAVVLGIAMLGLTGSTSWDLPTGAPAASPTEVVFATGDQLHVGSRTYPARPAPQTMVSTAGGLYYLSDGVLHRWGPDGSTRIADIGGIGWLSTTADGRYLAFVDFEHGPRNARGSRIAQTVVFDTTSGRELVRDATGNGARTSTEDLSDLYAESTPTVLGFDDDAVYAQTAKGGLIRRWDLVTGTRSDLPGGEYPVTGNRPGGPLVGFDLVHGVPRETPGVGVGAHAGRRSPDGTRLAYTLVGRPLVYTSGDRHPARIPVGGRDFVLAGWLDDEDFYGLGLDETRGTAQVLVCSASSLRCHAVSGPVPAEEGTLPVFPTGDFPY